MSVKEEQYAAYQEQELYIASLKTQIKELNKNGERAANAARYATPGGMKEKLAAIRAAWAPFESEIHAVELAAAFAKKQADAHWDAFQMADSREIEAEMKQVEKRLHTEAVMQATVEHMSFEELEAERDRLYFSHWERSATENVWFHMLLLALDDVHDAWALELENE